MGTGISPQLASKDSSHSECEYIKNWEKFYDGIAKELSFQVYKRSDFEDGLLTICKLVKSQLIPVDAGRGIPKPFWPKGPEELVAYLSNLDKEWQHCALELLKSYSGVLGLKIKKLEDLKDIPGQKFVVLVQMAKEGKQNSKQREEFKDRMRKAMMSAWKSGEPQDDNLYAVGDFLEEMVKKFDNDAGVMRVQQGAQLQRLAELMLMSVTGDSSKPIVESLKKLGTVAPLLTFNYDTLLEQVLRRTPVAFDDIDESKRDRMFSTVCLPNDGHNVHEGYVTHLHGTFSGRGQFVLTSEGYEKSSMDSKVPEFLEYISSTRSLIMVGMDRGMFDANMVKFWWARAQKGEQRYHFFLTKNAQDKDFFGQRLQKLSAKERKWAGIQLENVAELQKWMELHIKPVRYGSEYDHLPKFLEAMASYVKT